MKKLLLITQFLLFITFNFFLLMAGYQFISSSDSIHGPGYGDPIYDAKEEFDPSLSRLNTMKKLSAYCDSLYMSQATANSVSNSSSYASIANQVIRKRFYHGYSRYSAGKNFMASAISQMSEPGLSAIVIPDDILAYPFGACSQQSIILMELFRQQGIATRKVGFTGNITGHFTLEAYYDHDWHYFDPDKEPNQKVLAAYNYPSIAYLNSHPDVLLKAYSNHTKEYVMDVFTKYSYGAVSVFPAPKAIIFQKVAKFLSYTMWFYFLLAFIVVRRKYKRLGIPRLVKSQRRPFMIKRSIPAYSAA